MPQHIDSVLTSREAAARFGANHVRWMVSSGRWQRPAKGLVVLHSGPLSRDEVVQCELLLQHPDAALAGLTAATVDGLTGFTSPAVFIVTPQGSHPRRRPGVVVHRTGLLGEADVHPARKPRRTRLPRSILDAASWTATDLGSQAIIAAAVQQGLVTPEALRSVIERRPLVTRRGLIVETITDVDGGALSEYEVLFAKLCRRYGFPTPTRQRRRKDSSGRWRYLDVEFDAYRLIVEIDGQQHMEVLPWWEDMMRNNELVVDENKTLLRFAGFALRHKSERVAEVLLKFFRTRAAQLAA